MLNDGFSEKGFSEVQYNVLKLTLSQISKADIREAQLINTTVEHEVINSAISQTDKALILTINSILAQDFEDKLGKLGNFPYDDDGEQTFQFKKTAAVIILVITAVAVGAAAGALLGVVYCCGDFTGNTCTWNCVGDNVNDGASLGLLVALMII